VLQIDMVAEYTATNTANKSHSVACQKVEASSYNAITIDLSLNERNVTVSGAPSRYDHLITTIKFDGSRVSID